MRRLVGTNIQLCHLQLKVIIICSGGHLSGTVLSLYYTTLNHFNIFYKQSVDWHEHRVQMSRFSKTKHTFLWLCKFAVTPLHWKFPFHKVLEQRLEVSSWCLTDSCLVIRQAFLKWVNINSCSELPGRQVDGQDVHSLKGVTMQSFLQGSKQGREDSGREESEHLNTDKCWF